MSGWNIVLDGVNVNNEEKVINKIQDKLMKIINIEELEPIVMAQVLGFKSDSECYLIIEDANKSDMWVKCMSPGGIFDNQMADRLEKYLKANDASYERNDGRKFFINANDFKRLFRED